MQLMQLAAAGAVWWCSASSVLTQPKRNRLCCKFTPAPQYLVYFQVQVKLYSWVLARSTGGQGMEWHLLVTCWR